MKTSKRMLAIVLALVMSFGFVLSASAADYTYADQNDISAEYAEAVAFMKDLGIMGGSSPTGGTDDWEFRPDAKLTRAEVCKILFVLYITNDKADSFKDMPGFTDVKATDWFAGFVNWAKSKGVVSGSNAAGTAFSPYGNVKLVEACKMFLVAMGYDAVKENMVGPGWEGFTMSIALQSGLLEGLESINNTAELTREQLAQLCSNTLYATSVKYVEGNLEETGDTVLKKYFKFEDLVGVVVATPVAYLSDEASEPSAAGKTTIKITGSDDDYQDGEITVDLPIALGLEYLGRSVSALAKATATKTSGNNPVIKSYSVSKVYSTSFDDKIYSATAGDIDVVGATVVKGATDYLSYKDSSDTVHESDALGVANTDGILYLGYNLENSVPDADETLAEYLSIDDEDPAVVVCNSKGKILRVLVKDYSFAKVAVNAAGKIAVSGAWTGSIAKSDIIVGQNLAVKDTYVLGYEINDKYGLDAPTVITAKMSSIKGTASDTYVINGKDYTLSTLTGAATDRPNGLRSKDATYYVLGSKILKAIGDADDADSSDYCIVTASNWSTTGSSGKAYVDVLTDGNVTYSDLVVKDGKQTDYTPQDKQKGKIFAYSLSSDKKTITLTALAGDADNTIIAANPSITITEGVGVKIGTNPRRTITDDSVFFVYDEDEDAFYTYKGAKLPKLNAFEPVAPAPAVNPSALEGLFETSSGNLVVLSLKGVPDTATDSVAVRGLLISAELEDDFADNSKDIVKLTVLVDDSDVPAVFYTRKNASGSDVSLSTLAKTHVMLLINQYATETVGNNSYNVISQFKEIAPAGWLTASATAKEGVYGGYITFKTSNFLIFETAGTVAGSGGTPAAVNGSSIDLLFASDMEVYFVNGDDEATKGTISDIAVFEGTKTKSKWNAVVSLNADEKISKLYIYESDELWD